MSDDDLPEVMIPPLRSLLVERNGSKVRITFETLSDEEGEELDTLLCAYIRAGAMRLTLRRDSGVATTGGLLN